MNIESLPSDVVVEICKNLNIEDIASMYKTSSSLRDMIKLNSDYIYTICTHIQPHGLITSWWDEDRTMIKSEISYVDGVLHGTWKYWYSNGQLADHCFYINNRVHGEYTQWYNSGQIANRCFYINGKLHGEYKRWYSNNKIAEHCFYSYGMLIKTISEYQI